MKRYAVLLLVVILMLAIPQMARAQTSDVFNVKLLDITQSTETYEDSQYVHIIALFEANWYEVLLVTHVDGHLAWNERHGGLDHTVFQSNIQIDGTINGYGNHSIRFDFYNFTAYAINGYSTDGLNASTFVFECFNERPEQYYNTTVDYNEPWYSPYGDVEYYPPFDNTQIAMTLILCVLCIVGWAASPKRKRHTNPYKIASKAMMTYKEKLDNEVRLVSEKRAEEKTNIELIEEKVRDDFMRQVNTTLSMYVDPDPRMIGLLREPKIVKLPAYSDPTDDSDWRVCQYCGEWNRGKDIRCSFCGGRLGRPLGRSD